MVNTRPTHNVAASGNFRRHNASPPTFGGVGLRTTQRPQRMVELLLPCCQARRRQGRRRGRESQKGKGKNIKGMLQAGLEPATSRLFIPWNYEARALPLSYESYESLQGDFVLRVLSSIYEHKKHLCCREQGGKGRKGPTGYYTRYGLLLSR